MAMPRWLKWLLDFAGQLDVAFGKARMLRWMFIGVSSIVLIAGYFLTRLFGPIGGIVVLVGVAGLLVAAVGLTVEYRRQRKTGFLSSAERPGLPTPPGPTDQPQISAPSKAAAPVEPKRTPVTERPGWLPMGDRDALRAIIREGDKLTPTVGSVRRWTDKAVQFLAEHGQDRAARKLRSGEPDSDEEAALLLKARLVDLRVVLVSNIPPGINEDLTPLENFERYMEVRAIPETDRPRLRQLAEDLMKEAERNPSDAKIAQDLEIAVEDIDDDARAVWWDIHGGSD